MPKLRTAAAVACLLAQAACSWITVARPPQGPVEKNEKLACTTSVAAPVADTVVGSAALVLGGAGVGIGAAALSGCDWTTCWIQEPVAISYLALGIVLVGVAVMDAFSAAHGYSETAVCRDLEQAQLACVSGVEASCAVLQAPR